MRPQHWLGICVLEYWVFCAKVPILYTNIVVITRYTSTYVHDGVKYFQNFIYLLRNWYTFAILYIRMYVTSNYVRSAGHGNV